MAASGTPSKRSSPNSSTVDASKLSMSVSRMIDDPKFITSRMKLGVDNHSKHEPVKDVKSPPIISLSEIIKNPEGKDIYRFNIIGHLCNDPKVDIFGQEALDKGPTPNSLNNFDANFLLVVYDNKTKAVIFIAPVFSYNPKPNTVAKIKITQDNVTNCYVLPEVYAMRILITFLYHQAKETKKVGEILTEIKDDVFKNSSPPKFYVTVKSPNGKDRFFPTFPSAFYPQLKDFAPTGSHLLGKKKPSTGAVTLTEEDEFQSMPVLPQAKRHKGSTDTDEFLLNTQDSNGHTLPSRSPAKPSLPSLPFVSKPPSSSSSSSSFVCNDDEEEEENKDESPFTPSSTQRSAPNPLTDLLQSFSSQEKCLEYLSEKFVKKIPQIARRLKEVDSKRPSGVPRIGNKDYFSPDAGSTKTEIGKVCQIVSGHLGIDSKSTPLDIETWTTAVVLEHLKDDTLLAFVQKSETMFDNPNSDRGIQLFTPITPEHRPKDDENYAIRMMIFRILVQAIKKIITDIRTNLSSDLRDIQSAHQDAIMELTAQVEQLKKDAKKTSQKQQQETATTISKLRDEARALKSQVSSLTSELEETKTNHADEIEKLKQKHAKEIKALKSSQQSGPPEDF